jgi:hypothetical protein
MHEDSGVSDLLFILVSTACVVPLYFLGRRRSDDFAPETNRRMTIFAVAVTTAIVFASLFLTHGLEIGTAVAATALLLAYTIVRSGPTT